mmetsp:Transcript_12958/g.29376  ORF Transcript_12958/g.29376 Transcript_12958/m.29376 type:complete len:244 (+) Transcript_12958:73-804(+)
MISAPPRSSTTLASPPSAHVLVARAPRPGRAEARRGATQASFTLVLSGACAAYRRSKAALRYKLQPEVITKPSRVVVETKPGLWKRMSNRMSWIFGGKKEDWKNQLAKAEREVNTANLRVLNLQKDIQQERWRSRGQEVALEHLRPKLHAAECSARELPHLNSKIELQKKKEIVLKAALAQEEENAVQWEKEMAKLQKAQQRRDETNNFRIGDLTERLRRAAARCEWERQRIEAQKANTVQAA